MKQKQTPKSTLLADSTRGWITTKKQSPGGGGGKNEEISMKNIGVKGLITNRIN